MPFSDWLQHRFFHPDTEDEMRVLGMHGAQELTHSRDRFYNTIQNIHSPQVEKGHGGDAPLSDDELAALQLHAAGLDPALQEAAKTYHDVHHVPVPLPELGHAGPHFGPLGAVYPTGARIGYISSLGPSWLETPEAAQWAATGHTTHPWITGIELATLAPFGRPIRGARAIATALRAGGDEAARIASERAAEIEARLSERETRLLALARANQAAGRGLTREQSAVLHRIERELVNPRKSVYRSVMEGRSLVGAGVAKGTSKIRYRTFRAGGEEVQIPAARAYTGRAIEGVADALRRHADGKMPLFKSEAERALEEVTRGQKYRNRVEEGKIARLQQLGQRLSDEQEYAIRLALEQSPPDVAYLHHVELMKSADTEEQRVYHAMHASIIERAKKYLRVDDAGEVHLIEDLPHPKIAKAFGDKPPMREALGLMQEVAQGREDIYKAMGMLSDEAIARRIAGPARVRKGARFVEAEDELRQALKDSPIRPQIEAAARATAERMTDDPKRQRIAVEASMNLWEARIRAAALRYAGNQREWPQIIAYLRGVEVGSTEIPHEALTQNMDDLMQRFQAGEISLDEFNAAMSGEAFNKRTLSNAYVLGQPFVTATGERGITVEDLGNAVRANFDGAERVVPKSEIPDAPQAGETTLFQRQDITAIGAERIKGSPSPFYRPIVRLVVEMPEKFSPQELMGRIKKAGIKDEEIKYSQLDEFLAGAEKSISKEEVLSWLDKNYLQIEENLRHTIDSASYRMDSPESDFTKFHTYSLPGAHRPEMGYKELTIRLPADLYGEQFQQGGHFPDWNVLVHVRLSDRPVNGKRGLLIEEIQSDWHQAGQKRGYAQPLESHPDYERRVQEEKSAASVVAREEARLRLNPYLKDVERDLGVSLSSIVQLLDLQRNLLYADRVAGGEGRIETRTLDRGNTSQVLYYMRGDQESGGRLLVSFHSLFSDPQEERVKNIVRAEQVAARYNEIARLTQHERTAMIEQVQGLERAVVALQEKRSLMAALVQDVERGVADAPFKKTWHELALKRMLAWAVDNGYEKLAWTTGRQQAERYDLANFFDKITVDPATPNWEETLYSDAYYSTLDNEWYSYQESGAIEDQLPPQPDESDYVDPNTDEMNWDTYHDDVGDWEREVEQKQDDIRAEFENEFHQSWLNGYYADETGRYDDGSYELRAWQKGSSTNNAPDAFERVSEDQLDEYVGKELADRIRSGETEFTGDGLLLGEYSKSAQGAMLFYDKKLTGFVSKYLKKYGVELKQEPLGYFAPQDEYQVNVRGLPFNQYATRAEAEESAARWRQIHKANPDETQIQYRVIDRWVGPFGKLEYRAEPGPDGWDIMRRQQLPDGTWVAEEKIITIDGTSEEAQTVAKGYQARAEAAGHAEEGAPWGELVHSVDLPGSEKPTWQDFIQYREGEGRPVGRHDISALKEFADWRGLPHPLQDFVEQGQPLFQRGGGLERIGPFGVKGFTSYSGPAHAVQAVVGFTEHADLSTFVHEVFGHWLAPFVPDSEYRSLAKWAGGNFDQSRGPIDVAAAEKVAEGWEKYILEGRGPTPVRQAVRSLAPFLRELYDGTDLPDLTPRVREIFDRALAHEKLKGGRLVGPEDFEEVGIARVATFPGRPLPSGIRSVRPRVAGMSAYILSRGKVVGRGAADKALHNEYRGAALISGYFTADAVAPTARDAFLAVRLATVHRVRESLIRAGSEIPSDYTDIAVKINPDKTTPKNVAITLDKMREIDAKGGKLSRADMEQIDFDILEEGGRDVMPHQLLDAEGNPKDIREWAQEVMNTQEPIENIVWVPRDWIDASGLMPPTGRMAHLMAGVRGGKGMMAVDAINDLQKIMVLYLNPSYIPVNLVGNLVMNTMHQGVFTPVNLWRSAMMHQWLEGWERKTVDRAMGNGLTASLALRSGPGQIVHSTLGYWINQAVDLIPRRAAWLHEARRAGYKSKEQVRDLIRRAESGDEAAMHDMEMIARTANDAIVDYERMSPLEREITSRLIFFYPWLKGASRYSIRFAVEHPVQFTALALAAEHAYAVQQGELGPVPFYEFTDVPVSTKSIGVGRYSLADVFGEHEWRRGGLPMVVDARQILTFTTPMDIYRAGFALVTGDKNAPSLVDNLTPFVGASMVALQGYDPFRHQEVPRSLSTFLKQFEQVPQVQKWKLLTMSPEERRIYMEKSINPRTREEAWWYTFGSGLAPSRYNPKVAAKRLLSDAPTKIRHKTELTEGAKQFGLGAVTDQILAQQSEYDDFEHELKTGMKSTEKLNVATKYLRLHPSLRHAGDIDRVIQEHVHTQGDAENLYRAIRHDLEYHAWGDYWRMKTDLARKQKKATGKEKISG